MRRGRIPSLPGWQFAISCGKKDRQTGAYGANFPGELLTRHTRHDLIRDDQIEGRCALSEDVEGALTRGNSDHLVTGILEHRGGTAKDQMIIIDQEHFKRGGDRPLSQTRNHRPGWADEWQLPCWSRAAKVRWSCLDTVDFGA